MQAAMVDFAEPFGPCSKVSRLGRPSRTKLESARVNLLLDLLLPDQCAAGQAPCGLLPRELEERVAGEIAPRVVNGDFAEVVEDVAHIAARVTRVADGVGVE